MPWDTCLGWGLSRFHGYPYPTLYLSSRPKTSASFILQWFKNRSKINEPCPVQSTLQHSTVVTTWVTGKMSLIGRKGQGSMFRVRGLYLAVGGQCCVSDIFLRLREEQDSTSRVHLFPSPSHVDLWFLFHHNWG